MNDFQLRLHARSLADIASKRNKCLENLGGYDFYKDIVPFWEYSDYFFKSSRNCLNIPSTPKWSHERLSKSLFYDELTEARSGNLDNPYLYTYFFKHSERSVALLIEVYIHDSDDKVVNHFAFSCINTHSAFVQTLMDKTRFRLSDVKVIGTEFFDFFRGVCDALF